MRNISDKAVEKIKTHSMFRNFFFSENGAVYETVWEYTYGRARDRARTTILYDAENTRFACRITRARIHTHTQKY